MHKEILYLTQVVGRATSNLFVFLVAEMNADMSKLSESGVSVMHRAAKDDNYFLITFLRDNLEMKVDEPDENGETPLHHACAECACWSIHWLLAFRVDVNARNKRGQTPLHLLAMSQRLNELKTVRQMLNHGAEASAVDADNLTPLDAFKTQTRQVAEKFRTGLEELLDPRGSNFSWCSK